jgi:dipeptidase E
MTMRLLLGSGGFRTPERIVFLADLMRQFFGPIRQLLFLPYALQDHDRYVQTLTEKGIHAGYELNGIHRHQNPRAAIEQAEALFIGGGNTFRLLNELYHRDLLNVIRQRVHGGLPYLGISAGANVACPTIMTTNDMPIVQPPSFAALGLVPFQINPHYYTGQVHVKTDAGYQEHFGETRDERIREFHELNDVPVLGLWEAGVLRVENGLIELLGAPARLFRKGSESVDLGVGAKLDELLAHGA